MESKLTIVKEIEPIITKYLTDNRYYVEPFASKLNMICNINHPKRLMSDSNNYLIAMWRFLIKHVELFPTEISFYLYLKYREKFHEKGFHGMGDTFDEAIVGWFGFMGSFNNVFFGEYVNEQDYINEQIKKTISQIEKMKGVWLDCGRFDKIYIPDNSVIYCELPHQGVKEYFWGWCRQKTKTRNDVFILDYQAPQDFVCIWQKSVTKKLYVHELIADKYIQK